MNHETTNLPGVSIGRVHGVTSRGAPLIRFDGGAQVAAARVVRMGRRVEWRDHVGADVVLAFEEGDANRPIVLGLLEGTGTDTEPAAEPDVLRLSGRKEVIIECGRARISLRADGKVTLMGDSVLSRSTGPNKIKGGSVSIN